MERKAYCEFRLLFCHFLTWIDAGASDRWHFLIGHCRHQPADTDVFPVVADLSTRKVTGWEKRRPEMRLCPQVYRRLCPHRQPNWQVWNEIFNVIALNSANLILNATVDNRRLKCQTIREKNVLVTFSTFMVSTIKVPVESFLRDLHYTGDNRSIAFYRLFIDWFIHSFIHSLPTGF